MENSLIEATLHKIFKHLKDNELKNVAQVCRFWWKTAKNEYKLRGPMSVTKVKDYKNLCVSWSDVKTDIIKSYGARPCLQIFFIRNLEKLDFQDKCHCPYMASNSFSLVLETDYSFILEQNESILRSLVFPKTSKTKITTYTFRENNLKGGLFCEELRFDCGIDINKVKFLKTHMQSNFKDNGCMIILCNFHSLNSFIDCILILLKWFKESKIHIWGGIVDSMNVCQYLFKKHLCRIDPEFTIIFINNPNLTVWTENLNKSCDTLEKIENKLIALKKIVRLKGHSVALMYTSYYRIKSFYKLEESLFRQIFPNVALFHIYGSSSFTGESTYHLNEFFVNGNSTYVEFQTSIIIITYN